MPAVGQFGLAVSSSSPAVAARCAYARAGVGAAGSQNITDPTLGPKLLDLMAIGLSAPDAVAAHAAATPMIAYRQLIAVDSSGRTGAFSGERTLGQHTAAHGEGAVAAGNMLKSTDVPHRMIAAFESSAGSLGGRLIADMRAGLDAGGEEGPVHSAGLILVRNVAWPVADLRVDWSDDDPIRGLEQLWQLYEPQLEAYVTRALDPTEAPSYGVPGDR